MNQILSHHGLFAKPESTRLWKDIRIIPEFRIPEREEGYFRLSQAPLRESVIHLTENCSLLGGSEGLDLVARALINPGDEVIVVEPCFVAYNATVKFAHGVPVTVETKPENGYKLMPEELEAAITEKTKYMVSVTRTILQELS